MIRGIGTDLLDMRRLFPGNLRENDPFFRRAFTPGEIAQGLSRADKRSYFAGRFAAKEAVFKALRTSSEGADLGEIEILDDAEGRPCCALRGDMAARAGENARLHVSVSWDGDWALAFAVYETDD